MVPSIKETAWPESCPMPEEETFVSICCGNSNIHWALHRVQSKYDTQDNLQPIIIWKTPHIMAEDFGGDEANILARLLPRRLQKQLFGTSDEFSEKVAKEESKNRGHDITFYIISSNSKQAERISTLLSSVPCRLFKMKGDDFFTKNQGRYETMGIDRCACLKGSLAIYGAPTLVIDGGSAITYTAVDSEGNVMGGGISPGIKMRFKAMHEDTGALPEIEISAVLKQIRRSLEEKIPMPTFSKNTQQAMIMSTLNEIAAHLRHVINIWLEKVEPGTNPKRIVTVTGGSGEIITKLLHSNSGGILESSNGEKNKFEVRLENSLLHTGVASALLCHINDKHVEEKEPANDMKYLGQRIAKHFDVPASDNDSIYRGSVEEIKHSHGGTTYVIQYDDNDKEIVTLETLQGKNAYEFEMDLYIRFLIGLLIENVKLNPII
jgi:pantothenate kinase type III